MRDRLDGIVCVRTDGDTSGEDSVRVRLCLAFVFGRCGKSICDAIIALHDHKGQLTVSTTRDLTKDEQIAFRDAWNDMCWEERDRVAFVSFKKPSYRGDVEAGLRSELLLAESRVPDVCPQTGERLRVVHSAPRP